MGCDLYAKCKCNVSQLSSLPDIWAKIMGASHMQVRPGLARLCAKIYGIKMVTSVTYCIAIFEVGPGGTLPKNWYECPPVTLKRGILRHLKVTEKGVLK